MNDIKSYLSVFNTIFPRKKFIYMSTPITTGPLFIEWYNKVGKNLKKDSAEYKKSHREEVIIPNEKDAWFKAQSIWERMREQVINPTELDVNFTQEEFLLFWTAFLKIFVRMAVFNDGWVSSKGCLTEFLYCLNNKIPCFDFKLNQISKSIAIEQIRSSNEQLKILGLECQIQEHMLKVLET